MIAIPLPKTVQKSAPTLPTPLVSSVPATPVSPKRRLIARWLRDEKNHLYCQWVTEA